MNALDMAALLTAAMAALYCGVSVQTIVNWRNRGHLEVATDAQGEEVRDRRGRPMYRLRDVIRAEAAVKRRREHGTGPALPAAA